MTKSELKQLIRESFLEVASEVDEAAKKSDQKAKKPKAEKSVKKAAKKSVEDPNRLTVTPSVLNTLDKREKSNKLKGDTEDAKVFHRMRSVLTKHRGQTLEAKDIDAMIAEMQCEECWEEKLDPVGQEDRDVNNDGKVDSTDDYLQSRRDAIGAAIEKSKKMK